MSAGTRRPETDRIVIPPDDWIVVKRFLTAGEQRRIFRLMMRAGVRGVDEIDTLNVGLSKMIVYLLDWSYTDPDGAPLVIAGQPEATIAAILENLDVDVFRQVLEAVEAHESAIDARRAAEKNGRGGEMKSSAISPLPAPLAGDTNGSQSSIGTSTGF